MSRWGVFLGVIALAGCSMLTASENFVLPASFTDVTCSRHARERGQDALGMGYPQALQVRMARDAYDTCLRARN